MSGEKHHCSGNDYLPALMQGKYFLCSVSEKQFSVPLSLHVTQALQTINQDSYLSASSRAAASQQSPASVPFALDSLLLHTLSFLHLLCSPPPRGTSHQKEDRLETGS